MHDLDMFFLLLWSIICAQSLICFWANLSAFHFQSFREILSDTHRHFKLMLGPYPQKGHFEFWKKFLQSSQKPKFRVGLSRAASYGHCLWTLTSASPQRLSTMRTVSYTTALWLFTTQQSANSERTSRSFEAGRLAGDNLCPRRTSGKTRDPAGRPTEFEECM